MLVGSGDSLAIRPEGFLLVFYCMDFSFADGLMEVLGVSNTAKSLLPRVGVCQRIYCILYF